MTADQTIEEAEHIVSEYGKVLSSIEPSIYGIAISRLPFPKEQIKIAIQTLILAIDKNDLKVQEGLIQAYVYLAQFIEDEKVMLAEKGRVILEKDSHNTDTAANEEQATEDLELANKAVQTINSIKTEMENLMSEIRLLIS